MEKHNWPAVMAALQDMLEDSKENEPYATMLHSALEEVIASLPDAAYE